jgi:hypothetical protein
MSDANVNVQIAVTEATERYEKIEARLMSGGVVRAVWERGRWRRGSLCMIETDNSDAELAMVEAALDARDRLSMAENVRGEDPR